MKGAARAAERAEDQNTRLAYLGIVFYGLAQKGKLRSVGDYLIAKPTQRAQTADEMFEQLRGVQMRGAAIDIRQMN